jgi:hypothetical protein
MAVVTLPAALIVFLTTLGTATQAPAHRSG